MSIMMCHYCHIRNEHYETPNLRINVIVNANFVSLISSGYWSHMIFALEFYCEVA
jgi:DNA repair photolyase